MYLTQNDRECHTTANSKISKLIIKYYYYYCFGSWSRLKLLGVTDILPRGSALSLLKLINDLSWYYVVLIFYPSESKYETS